MGYAAYGSGDATLKPNTDINKLTLILDDIIIKYCSDLEYEFDNKNNQISFWEHDTHWHEKDTMEFLNALIPHIIEGCAVYDGEDSCYWKYIFENNKWVDYSGTIYYTTEEMIKELENQGYIITKP